MLGPVVAWRNDTKLALGSARRTAVLAVLALRCGQAVTLDELVAAVWGDDAPATATGNVYTYISSLRALLEPDRDRRTGRLLMSGGGTYRLHLRPEAVDVFAFEALRDESRRHRAAAQPEAELNSLKAALRLWRGEALTGVPGPFAAAQRLRLAELRLVVDERRATLLSELGRRHEAAQVPQNTYPLQADLRAGLGDPLDARPPVRANTPPGRESRAKLLGRDDEVRTLRQAAAEAVAGRGGAIRIDGAPGMGRSALLDAALSGIATGRRIGWAVGTELAGRRPLGLLLECLESAVDGTEHNGISEQLAAVAGDALGAPEEETVQRAIDVIRAAVAQAPLVLVADDAHRADPVTLRVWAELSAQAPALPLLLVATGRAGATELRHLPADVVLVLPPLRDEAAAALARTTARSPIDARGRRRLLADAGGNPRYVRLLAENGPDAPLTGPVPGIGELVAACPAETNRLLHAVALLSAHDDHPAGCSATELAIATDQDRNDVLRLLAPIGRAGLVTVEGDHVAFRPPVIGRILRDRAPAGLVLALHRSFAERLGSAGLPPERVVGQLVADRVPVDGAIAAWLIRHAETLASRTPQAALTVFRRAHTQPGLSDADRLALTAWLARLLVRRGDSAVAEAGWVAARTTDPELAGEMRRLTGDAYEAYGVH